MTTCSIFCRLSMQTKSFGHRFGDGKNPQSTVGGGRVIYHEVEGGSSGI